MIAVNTADAVRAARLENPREEAKERGIL